MKEVVIYTLDYCPFCHKALKTLQEKGIEFKHIDATNNEDKISEDLKNRFHIIGEVTYPQIIIDGKHFGGNDDLQDSIQNGAFNKMFKS